MKAGIISGTAKIIMLKTPGVGIPPLARHESHESMCLLSQVRLMEVSTTRGDLW
jgi:hypothetical protein